MEETLYKDLHSLATPCYVVDEGLLQKNLELLQEVSQKSGCKILLAQKAFSMFASYPLLSKYLSGTTASGLYEAKLGYEEMAKESGLETHVFSAAYIEAHMEEIFQICDHISFNSFSQWEKYRQQAISSGKSCGIRINPEHSTQEHGIYDPCSAGSRLGVTLSQFREELLEGIEGLHFHCLCQQNVDALQETLAVVEKNFGKYLPQMKWVNFGGGHHITRDDYDRDTLIGCIQDFRERHGVEVYLEPGEAVALNAGFLVTSVLDIVENHDKNAILDASAACHMPDVLEMPYRPPLYGSGQWEEKAYDYRLGGPTCLAGDIIGEYAFDKELSLGDKLIFEDMAIYSMVKNNTFNGMPLPDLVYRRLDGGLDLVRRFSYEDFKNRLS